MNDPTPPRILVIDDDPSILVLFQAVLGTPLEKPACRAHAIGEPAEVLTPFAAEPPVRMRIDTACSGAEGIQLLDAAFREDRPYAIAFIDLTLPGMDGMETAQRFWAIDESLLVVIFTASAAALRMVNAATLPQSDRLLLLRKPLHPVEIRQVAHFLDKRRRAERALQCRTLELHERIKELHCLQSVSRLMEDTVRPLPELLVAMAELIPAAFQHPERVCCRVVLADGVYASRNFQETPWTLATPIIVDGRLVGALEACCLDEGPFHSKPWYLEEERAIIDELGIRTEELLTRNDAKNKLLASEDRYRALFESSQDAIMATDVSTGMFTAANPAALALFGATDLEQFLLIGPSDLSPALQPDGRPSREKTREMIDRAVRDGSAHFEWQHNRWDGTEFPATVVLTSLQLSGRAIVQATVRDISEQKRMQAELAQAQRLEAIGQLAAGIAHEINTPTQYIGDNTRFLGDAFHDLGSLFDAIVTLVASEGQPSAELLDRLQSVARATDLQYLAEEIPRAVEQSLDGIERVAEIVRAMKEFSHPGSDGKVSVDLNRALESTLTVCRNEWKYVADLVTDFDPTLPPVPCHPGELNQAILNMVINAAHAVAEKVGSGDEKGTITVRTRRNGCVAEIVIADTGTGIPEHLQFKIFDLFFTTKRVGKGTGQGLTMARSIIVEKHGGAIECRSTLGKGTTFIVRLPLETAPAEGSAGNVMMHPRGLQESEPGRCTA